MKHQKLKHYLVSSVITFITGFLSGLVLTIDKFNLQSIESGAWIGFILVCIRMGTKFLVEKWLQKLIKM